jgi:UDP:flavonoid glycosyltransferase YjiC (YdhE family)
MKILLCPLSDGGYLYPAIGAGRELRRRGHEVSVLARLSAAPIVAGAGLPHAVAEEHGGHRAFAAARWGEMGLAQYQATLAAARQARADMLVTSVLCHGALVAAEVLDIPVVVIGFSVYLWDYQSGGAGEPQEGRPRDNRTRETIRLYASVREQAGLGGRSAPWRHDPLLGTALLLRGDPAFEYPGARLPARAHHVGPLAWEPPADRAEIEEIRERLARTGKPVVYAHLGRFFGGASHWPELNAAFTRGPFQAVVEQGRSTSPQPAPDADIVLVRKPWMGPLIEQAGLVLTSGTSAPVLSALLRGRPLAVRPNGSEQPVLAGACVRMGVAVRMPGAPGADHAAVLASAWRDQDLRERARAAGATLAAADSAARAADIIERAGAGDLPRSACARFAVKDAALEYSVAEGMTMAAISTPGGAGDCLDQVSAGAREWIGANAGYLDSLAAKSELPVTPRIKALLQLGLLHHYWRRAWPDDDKLAGVTAIVERAWRDPQFPRLMDIAPGCAAYRLIYGALAPSAVTTGSHRDGLAQVVGRLATRGRSPFARLETRYLADLAGVSHPIESYPDLFRRSILGDEGPGTPLAEMDVCEVTHTIFYLTHFGARDPGLAPGDLARAQAVARDLAQHALRHDEWEQVAKLLLAQFCLGGNPAATAAGQAGIRLLARAQMPDGAIPGPALARRAVDSATPVQYFRKSYQATLMTALMAVIISAGEPAAGRPARQEMAIPALPLSNRWLVIRQAGHPTVVIASRGKGPASRVHENEEASCRRTRSPSWPRSPSRPRTSKSSRTARTRKTAPWRTGASSTTAQPCSCLPRVTASENAARRECQVAFWRTGESIVAALVCSHPRPRFYHHQTGG